MNKIKRMWVIGDEAFTVKQEKGEPLMFTQPQIEFIEVSAYDNLAARLAEAEKVLQLLSPEKAFNLGTAYVFNEAASSASNYFEKYGGNK